MAVREDLKAPVCENGVTDADAIKTATATTGSIEYSPYSVFRPDTIVAIAPIGSPHFVYSEKLTFKSGRREYKDQRGIFVYVNGSSESRAVHFTGTFRNRPAISNSGDDDCLHQLLVQKIMFEKDGFSSEDRRVYKQSENPCTDFDDVTNVNYLRMSATASDWDVLQALAGFRWKVTHMVIAESRRFETGKDPKRIFIRIPIFQKLGAWNETDD